MPTASIIRVVMMEAVRTSETWSISTRLHGAISQKDYLHTPVFFWRDKATAKVSRKRLYFGRDLNLVGYVVKVVTWQMDRV
jgi:hypothetical protein